MELYAGREIKCMLYKLVCTSFPNIHFANMAQLAEGSSYTLQGYRFDSGPGWSPCKRQPISVSQNDISLSSHSLPLSLKTNDNVLG